MIEERRPQEVHSKDSRYTEVCGVSRDRVFVVAVVVRVLQLVSEPDMLCRDRILQTGVCSRSGR